MQVRGCAMRPYDEGGDEDSLLLLATLAANSATERSRIVESRPRLFMLILEF